MMHILNSMRNELQYEPTRRCWYIKEYRRLLKKYEGYVNQQKLARLYAQNLYVREFYANVVEKP